jgi:CRP/FNR family transcriptional regulator
VKPDPRLVRALSRCPLFSGVPLTDLRVLAGMARVRRLGAGEHLIEESTAGKDIFLVLSGRISVSLISSGRRKTINYVRPGEILGEIGFFTGRRSATCICEQPTEVAVVRYAELRRLIRRSTTLALNVIGILVRRLRAADAEIERLTFVPVLGRIAAVLLEHADDRGMVGLSVTGIAERVGATRETVSRGITRLVRIGVVHRAPGQRLQVPDPGRLRAVPGAAEACAA